MAATQPTPEQVKAAAYALGRGVAYVKYANVTNKPALRDAMLNSVPTEYASLLECFREVGGQTPPPATR